jgi:hypothetical protein
MADLRRLPGHSPEDRCVTEPNPQAKWTSANTIAALSLASVFMLASASGLWYLGVWYGKGQLDPTADLRGEIRLLQSTLSEFRAQVALLPPVVADTQQMKGDIRRLETTFSAGEKRGDERDARQDAVLELLRSSVAEQRERLAVIERTSSVTLPGRR